MIKGTVTSAKEAVIELTVIGAQSVRRQIHVVIDTGYTGYLTLPECIVSQLNLPFGGHRRGILADCQIVLLEMYVATVLWHSKQREILVAQSSGGPLLGMSLLEGSRLVIDVANGGTVTIEQN